MLSLLLFKRVGYAWSVPEKQAAFVIVPAFRIAGNLRLKTEQI